MSLKSVEGSLKTEKKFASANDKPKEQEIQESVEMKTGPTTGFNASSCVPASEDVPLSPQEQEVVKEEEIDQPFKALPEEAAAVNRT